MTMPGPGQTVHLMTWRDIVDVLKEMQRNGGRNVYELKLYATDDLRHLYQTESGDIIRLRDGIVTRTELVAVILWRVWWDRFWYVILLIVSIFGALAAISGFMIELFSSH